MSEVALCINPYPAKIYYFNFQQLQVVSRYRDSQPQVAENYLYLFYPRPNILMFNPSSPYDALKHHFTSLKTYLIFSQIRVLEGQFRWNFSKNTW